MLTPATVDLTADRWTPFVATLTFTGVTLTSATCTMHIRVTYDAPAAAVSLATVGSPATEGVYIVDASTLSIRINEATMEDQAKFPFPDARGDDLEYYYDIHITPSGGTKQVYLRGKFTVRAGATQ